MVLKALGDETRFSMYQELAGSTSPLTATELSERLGLHATGLEFPHPATGEEMSFTSPLPKELVALVRPK